MTDTSHLHRVIDHGGWFLGLAAVFKAAFGTDTEARLKAGGVKEEIADAKEKVGQMRQGAENLLNQMGEVAKDEVDVELRQLLNKL